MIQIDYNSPEPLYIQIRNGLREDIRNRTIAPGDKLPSDRDMANDLHVSRKIIRQALSLLTDEGLIRRRPQHGTTVMDIDPDAVQRNKTGILGVVMCGLHSDFVQRIQQGIQDELYLRDYYMFSCDSRMDMKREIENVNSLIDKKVDGLIIYPIPQMPGVRHTYSHYRRLQQTGIPFVLVDIYHKNMESDYVVFDNYGGAYNAVRYLANLGHRRIGYLTPIARCTSNIDRLEGYKGGLITSGIDVDENLIKHYYENSESLIPLASELLDNGVTAVLCFDQWSSQAIQNVLWDRNLRTPQDLSIVEFKDESLLMKMDPFITTVAVPSFELGRRAAQLLLKKVAGDQETVEKIVLDTRLIPGKTTAKVD